MYLFLAGSRIEAHCFPLPKSRLASNGEMMSKPPLPAYGTLLLMHLNSGSTSTAVDTAFGTELRDGHVHVRQNLIS